MTDRAYVGLAFLFLSVGYLAVQPGNPPEIWLAALHEQMHVDVANRYEHYRVVDRGTHHVLIEARFASQQASDEIYFWGYGGELAVLGMLAAVSLVLVKPPIGALAFGAAGAAWRDAVFSQDFSQIGGFDPNMRITLLFLACLATSLMAISMRIRYSTVRSYAKADEVGEAGDSGPGDHQ